jgi:lambda repressor-like predicted transcriptional regulator
MRREVPTFSKFHGTQPARAVFADPFAPRLRICHAPNSALPAVVLKDGVRTADTHLAAALRKRGLTMAAAAKQLGVAVSMLYAWKKPPKGARMVPVKIVPAATVHWCHHVDTGWKRRTWRRRWLYCGSLGRP